MFEARRRPSHHHVQLRRPLTLSGSTLRYSFLESHTLSVQMGKIVRAHAYIIHEAMPILSSVRNFKVRPSYLWSRKPATMLRLKSDGRVLDLGVERV
jgi:hypothetical protein